MIENLSIRSLGVISSAQLELTKGFTAITGETGAGKTMLLTGLGLLLGERADSSVVRSGEKQLVVEGRILSADKDLGARLEELGADVEAGEILINRIVSADGRSKAAIGGISVPVSVLNSVAQELVAVHGSRSRFDSARQVSSAKHWMPLVVKSFLKHSAPTRKFFFSSGSLGKGFKDCAHLRSRMHSESKD